MAQTEVARLYRSIQTNPALKTRLSSAANQEDFVNMAQSLGYQFTIQEFLDSLSFQVEEFECELSEIPGI